MSVSFTSVFTPAAADLPPGVDMDAMIAALGDDHVSAPSKDEDGLVAAVAQAKAHGIDLSIVVIPKNPRHDSQLRDLATEVGKHESGTVVVLSPDWVGTYSDSISRVQLEAAEDPAKNTGGNSTLAADKFVGDLIQPSLPWTAITCVLIGLTAAAVAGLYVLKSRRARTRNTEVVEPVHSTD